jgi:hypothetical protein
LGKKGSQLLLAVVVVGVGVGVAVSDERVRGRANPEHSEREGKKEREPEDVGTQRPPSSVTTTATHRHVSQDRLIATVATTDGYETAVTWWGIHSNVVGAQQWTPTSSRLL